MVLPRARTWILTSLLAAWACNCDEETAPAGSSCERAEDCDLGLVCDPTSRVCDQGASCTDNSSCGLGAICAAGGQCERNVVGGDCTDNSDCIDQERCAGGSCEPPGDVGAACTRASDCLSALICDPQSSVCATSQTCSTNADCGAGAICGPNMSCVQNTPGGSCTTQTDCVDGETCLSGSCVGGCGGEFYSAENVPPNLLIVIDRSGSMNDNIDRGMSKWDIARNSTNNLLTTYNGQIFFGLSLFPGLDQGCNDGMRCGPGAINVPIGAGKEMEIASFLQGADTCSFGTPIGEELEALQNYDGIQDRSRPNYILLLTDGQATCGDPVPEVRALREQDPEVKTFVVGFGAQVDPDQLADMAQEGGTALAGDPAYYQADDAASLRAAFASIAGNVLSCSYTLSEIPPDPDLLYVYFNGNEVARDMTRSDGWDHQTGTNQLTFYGDSCDALQSGSVQELTIVYGCPLPPGGPDAGVPDTGVPQGDGGIDIGQGGDAGPQSCTSCTQCGSQGCIIPSGSSSGMCGDCTTDFDCCLGAICAGGVCISGI